MNLHRLAAAALAWLIAIGARLLTGMQAAWAGSPSTEPTVYFANHASHGDFVLVWTALPPELRALTRPVAAQDYWDCSPVRRFIGGDVFRALMIRRAAGAPAEDSSNPVDQMLQALAAGNSLIMFPEGTRNTSDEPLLPLKSGLFHLATRRAEVRLVPVWIENLRRVLPKGAILPIPLACTVRFGAPLERHLNENKAAFLARARQALLALRPFPQPDDER